MMGGVSAAGSDVLGTEAEPTHEENTWATPSLELWFSMFQALPGFYSLFFAFQCWRLNSGLHGQVSSTVHQVPVPALWKEFPPPSIISLLFPLAPPSQLITTARNLWIVLLWEHNVHSWNEPLCHTILSGPTFQSPAGHTTTYSSSSNAPHLSNQHSTLEEMPNHDYH